MDIFRFIDSADIRRYLTEIQYRFSTEEKVFLIRYCNAATLNEKIVAWQEIVGYVPSCPWDFALDIRERVAEYIELQEKMLGAVSGGRQLRLSIQIDRQFDGKKRFGRHVSQLQGLSCRCDICGTCCRLLQAGNPQRTARCGRAQPSDRHLSLQSGR